jgi:hypothetical protein
MVSGAGRSDAASSRQGPLETGHSAPRVVNTWSTPSWFVAIFILVQLCIGLKYLQVCCRQVRAKIDGPQQRQSLSGSDQEGSGIFARGFPMPSPRRLLSGQFQRMFEEAAQQNFPGSATVLIPSYRDLSLRCSNASLLPVPKSSLTVEPLLGGCVLMSIGDDRRICGLPHVYREEEQARLSERAAYYNDLQATWPGVHFYVFPTLPVEDWYAAGGLYGAGGQKCLAGDRYVREFRTLLAPSIEYTWAGEGCSFRDAVARYYRTDHHWNSHGAYEAYLQLYQLLHRQNAQLGPPWAPRRWIELPGVVFHGSWARRAGYYEALGDVIVDGVFELPEHEVAITGFANKDRDGKRQYLSGRYAKGEFVNHYGDYFGSDYGLIHYVTPDAPGGRLLVINDSFDNSIEPLLATHFAQAWFVDLRLYARDTGGEFCLGDFLSCHGITDVLFLGRQRWILGLRPVEPYE